MQRWKDFLSLSIDERNQAVDLSSEIRRELKHHFTLRELELGSSWEDVDLKTLLNIRQDRLFEVMSKKQIRCRRVLGNLRELYAIIADETFSSVDSQMDDWIDYRHAQ